MLRGAIDYFDGHLLGGWIHSAAASLRDRTVLAFVDDACIGAGRVEKFRQDLADAGLGDGYCGFAFAVSPPPETPRARITIRLESSDFALLDAGARIVDPLDEATRARRSDYAIESIEWMRARKWLDTPDYEFLKDLTNAGVHDRLLGTPGGVLAPAAEAKRLLSLYRRGPVRVQEALIELRNLGDERAALVDGAIVPVIAIYAREGMIRRADGGPVATAPYSCAEDHLLFIDTRVAFGGDGDGAARVFRAV